MSSNQNAPSMQFASETTAAVYRPLHVERIVKIYPIQEHELITISTRNNPVTLWCSIGTIAATLLLGCIWDSINLPESASVTRQAWSFGFCCLAVSIASFLFAKWHHGNRKNVFERILGEVRP